MYFEALKIFCDVVRYHSFTRAATANQISQSAASQNVLQLEKGLGVRLIDRSKRPFRLTPEGQAYFDGCKDLVDHYYVVEAQVKALSANDQVAGTVRIAAIYSVGLGDMSRYVQQFAERFPKARAELAYLHPDRVYESVVEGDADIGLVSFPKSRPGLAVLPWRNEPMALVCLPNHRLAGCREIRPEQLAGERFVGFDEGLRIRREIDRYLRRHGAGVKVVIAFDNLETIKRAVEVGEGISILPAPTVAKEVRAGTLTTVPLAPGLDRPLTIIHRKSGVLSRTARSFVQLVQANGEAGSAEEASRQHEQTNGQADTDSTAAREQVTV